MRYISGNSGDRKKHVQSQFLTYTYSLSRIKFFWSTVTSIDSLTNQNRLERYTKPLSVPYPRSGIRGIVPAKPNTTPEIVRQNRGAKKNA
jgi:hypothetical protein